MPSRIYGWRLLAVFGGNDTSFELGCRSRARESWICRRVAEVIEGFEGSRTNISTPERWLAMLPMGLII